MPPGVPTSRLASTLTRCPPEHVPADAPGREYTASGDRHDPDPPLPGLSGGLPRVSDRTEPSARPSGLVHRLIGGRRWGIDVGAAPTPAAAPAAAPATAPAAAATPAPTVAPAREPRSVLGASAVPHAPARSGSLPPWSRSVSCRHLRPPFVIAPGRSVSATKPLSRGLPCRSSCGRGRPRGSARCATSIPPAPAPTASGSRCRAR